MEALGRRVEKSAAPGTGTGHRNTVAAYLEVKDGSLGPEGGGVCCPGYRYRHHKHRQGPRHPSQDVAHLVHVLTPASNMVEHVYR